MKLSSYTLALLEDIENRLDPETEEDFRRQWEDFWADRCTDVVFRAKRKTIRKPEAEIKKILLNDTLDDYELMLARELGQISQRLATPDTPRWAQNIGFIERVPLVHIYTESIPQKRLPRKYLLHF